MPYSSELHDFVDPSRDRPVPVKLYRCSGRPSGWVLLSVGFGGTRESYGYLAKAWTELGLDVAVVEHVGSNLGVLKSIKSPSRAQRNAEVVKRVSCPSERVARPRDFHWAYSRLASDYSGLPLAVVGHSFGTYTVMGALGMEPRELEPDQSLEAVPAQCALLMSPQPPGMLFEASEYEKLLLPTLVLTGTKDDLLDQSQDYLSRRGVFAELPTLKRHLLILEKVAHMTFAGLGLNIGKQLNTISELTSTWLKSQLFGASLDGWTDRYQESIAEAKWPS